MEINNRKWWKEAIVYQIYPRSFMDSNGDGIGDLKGIIGKLDYIQSLGIDVVWLNPVYSSPNDDNGYDISDYRNIMAEFGTMEEFDELLAGLHDRGIRLIMDLVVNHCSDEHKWFQESKKSRDNPYRDYFHWWPAEKGKPTKRWSFFDPDETAWKYEEETDSYYLHYFSQKQPDLNWENPKLRAEIYDMMHFWFKKGIDGFRMDVVTFISKDLSFPELPEEKFGKENWIPFYASGPRLHEYLHEMNREVLSKYDIMTVAEGTGTSPKDVLDFVAEERNELNMIYHFDHPNIGLLPRKRLAKNYRDLVRFKEVQSDWDDEVKDKGWGTIYLGNHDQPRMVSRWADDAEEHRELSAKLLNTLLLSMRGTPYLYQGDEIGMVNIKFDSIEDYRDIETINWYHLTKAEGGDAESLLEDHKITGRDNGRTPVQWNSSPNAGFTTGAPWLKVNPNYTAINVAQQEEDPNSVLNYFRQMVRLKKENPILIYGDLKTYVPEHPEIYAYTRSLNNESWLVVLNFSSTNKSFEIPDGREVDQLKINNYNSCVVEHGVVQLKAWQGVVLSLSLSAV